MTIVVSRVPNSRWGTRPCQACSRRLPWSIFRGSRLTTLPVATPRTSSKDLWLVSPGYDLAFIIFSSVLLVVPHLFATYTMTFMEPRFRERYRRYTWSALLLPVLVVSLAIYNLTLLVTVFFFWASVHVIHQAAYIADSYR